MDKFIDLSSVTNPRFPNYLALLALGQILAGEKDAPRERVVTEEVKVRGRNACQAAEALGPARG